MSKKQEVKSNKVVKKRPEWHSDIWGVSYRETEDTIMFHSLEGAKGYIAFRDGCTDFKLEEEEREDGRRGFFKVLDNTAKDKYNFICYLQKVRLNV